MSLKGQVAVITGGSGGIGWSAAQKWLDKGGAVVLADLQEEQGKALAASRPDVVFVRCDTRRKEDLERAAEAASRLGTVTCWFNNAGFANPTDSVETLKSNGFTGALRNMLEVNLSAYIEGVGVAMRSFDKDKGGVIINTASMAGILPLGAPPVYSASKGAVVHFTRAIGLTLGDASNVRVHCLCPSYTATSQGPPTDAIKASLGGVLRAEHMGEGFMMLAMQDIPNGSILRVTVRNRGTKVVHDLLSYGRELGGKAAARDGIILKEAPLEAVSDTEAAELDKRNESGRDVAGMQPSKL